MLSSCRSPSPKVESALKKQLIETPNFPSYDGIDLKILGSVAIVLAPRSNSFCLMLEVTFKIGIKIKSYIRKKQETHYSFKIIKLK